MDQHPPHSLEAAKIIERSLELSRWLHKNNPSSHTFDPLPEDPEGSKKALQFRMRHKLAFTFFEIALDHHTAIVLLCREHLHSSSFALARTMFDATWQGAWVAFAAPWDMLDQFTKGKFDPKPGSCIKVLEKKQLMAPLLSRIYKEGFATLSNYTHVGHLQVQRWLGEDEISPRHTTEELAELLRLCDQMALACGMFLSQICKTDQTLLLEKTGKYCAQVKITGAID